MSTLTKTEYHQCEAVKGDGEACTKQAKAYWGYPYGWRCGVHASLPLLRQDQLKAYERHQRAAFGGLVVGWTDDKLREREVATATVPENASKERGITIAAEHAAVVAEIERRRGREPEPAEGDWI